jgi:hypothetical protein
MQPASNRSALRLVMFIFALLHVLILPVQAGTGQMQAEDPYLLLEEINSHLEGGLIKAAGESLDHLKLLMAASPGWDPDGTFSQRLVPDLEHRIGRLRLASDQLDKLYREDWANTKIPDTLLAGGDVRRYLNWSTDTVYRLRERRDTIVNELGPVEKASLYEASAYDRIQTVLETGLVQRAHEFTREVVKRIGKEDERVRALRTRLENLKRDTVDLVAQREQLVQELDMSREKIEQYLNALSAMVTEGVGAPSDGTIPEAQQVDEVFFTLLNRRIEVMQAATTQSSAEKEARQEAVGRYRYYNRVLVRAGLVNDQEPSIATLEDLVTDLSVSDSTETAPSEAMAYSSKGWLFMGGGLLLAFATSLIWVKRRRPSNQNGPAPPDGPVDLLISDRVIFPAPDEESRRDSTGVR